VRTFQRFDGFTFKNDPVGTAERLHPQHPNPLLDQPRYDQLSKAAEMDVHQVEWHLGGIELEPVLRCCLKHIKVNPRVLVPGKADKANLTTLAGSRKSFHRPAFCEDAVGIVETENFMMLQQVNTVRLEPLQRFAGWLYRRQGDPDPDPSMRLALVAADRQFVPKPPFLTERSHQNRRLESAQLHLAHEKQPRQREDR
jgi:hypothetical protein